MLTQLETPVTTFSDLSISAQVGLDTDKMELSGLPNEILIHVLSFVHPRDLESFVVISKRIYNLATDALREHKELKQKYRKVDDREPYTVLRLLKIPRICWYIQEIAIYAERTSISDWQHCFDGSPCSDPSDRSPQKFEVECEGLDQLCANLRESTIFSKREATEWMTMVKTGKDWPLKIFLLSLAPNLKSLIVSQTWLMQPRTLFVEYLSFILRTLARTPEQLRPKAFESLNKVCLCSGRAPGATEFVQSPLRTTCVAPFFTLPALQELNISTNHDRVNRPSYSWDCGPAISNISVLDIHGFGGTSEELNQLIGTVRSLKSFRMTQKSDTYLDLHGLLKAHRHSLEILSFSRMNHNYNIAPLQHFKVLRFLKLEAGLLLEATGAMSLMRDIGRPMATPVVKISSLLPRSLEALKLYREQPNMYLLPLFQDFIDGLADLVKKKKSTQPKLRAICISLLRLQDDFPAWTRLREACKSNGVDLGRIFPADLNGPCPVCSTWPVPLGAEVENRMYPCIW
jgi:hypothetical protein